MSYGHNDYNNGTRQWGENQQGNQPPSNPSSLKGLSGVLGVIATILIIIILVFCLWFFGINKQNEDQVLEPVFSSQRSSMPSSATDAEAADKSSSNGQKNTEEKVAKNAGTGSEERGVGEKNSTELMVTTTAIVAPTTVSSTQRCEKQHWPSGFTNPTVAYCDGQWMYIGSYASDHTALFTWKDDSWSQYPYHGETFTGFGCYAPSQLDRDGVPPEVRAKLTLCSSSGTESEARWQKNTQQNQSGSSGTGIPKYIGYAGGQRSQTIACDGRYILIVQSVIDEGDEQATQAEIASALNTYPGSVFTAPGNCPSLRQSIDGKYIYPIYIDFGSDQQAACRAKSVHGGNVRTLNTKGDFSDPC